MSRTVGRSLTGKRGIALKAIRRSVLVLAATAAIGLSVAPAFAQYEQPTSTPTVEATIDRLPTEEASVLGETKTKPDVGGLSVTGADIAMFAAIGGGTFLTGSALVVAGRRRRTS
jgi:hypothetical protein